MKGNMETSSPSTPNDGAVQRPETRDWFVDSGALSLARVSTVSYGEYARRVSDALALPATFDDDCAQIDLDLDRIRSSLEAYLLDGNNDEGASDDLEESAEYVALVSKLRNVLRAYSVRNARVGYVQGHADLLCFVLAHTPTRHDEEQAFWIYTTILERIFPEDFFARTPKLHGFQVDVKLFQELMVQRLVPHVPQLAKVDMAFLASLLACKWFIPVWVGELPHSLLVDLWETMLCEEDGTYLHLVLALHFVRRACDSIASRGETAQWEASYVYKEVLNTCRGLIPSTSLRAIREEALSVYNLSDEGVEDWRASLRGQAPFLANETRALLHTVHFQPAEIARLHGEFMFARAYLKSCARFRLRGLREEFVDGLLAREFPMLPAELSRRIVDLLRRDAYGNISFYRLVQLLSVLRHGDEQERAMIMFSAADKTQRLRLDRNDIEALTDILCALAVHQVLHSFVEDRGEKEYMPDRYRLRRPEHSPLLRAHFKSLLEGMTEGSGEFLGHMSWLQGVSNCPDIRALVAEWGISTCDDPKRLRSQSYSVPHLLRRSGSSSVLANLAHSVSRTRMPREGSRKLKRPSASTVAGKERSKSTDDLSVLTRNVSGSPPLSLLTSQMRKRYQKNITTQDTRRSLGESSTLSSSLQVSTRSSDQVFWCECILS